MLRLKPVDTFFFRDHRPLSMGEDTAATGIFPPRPGTVYGALRSAYIHRHTDFQTFKQGGNDEVRRWMGTPAEPGEFSIRATFVYDGTEVLLPLPLDYQVVSGRIQDQTLPGQADHQLENEEERETALPLRLSQDDSRLAWDGQAWRLYAPLNQKSASSSDAYVPWSEWKRELLSRKGIRIQRPSRFVLSEPKIGIARNQRQNKAEEGMLYSMNMLRIAEPDGADKVSSPRGKAGFLVFCGRAPSYHDVPFARLGGEARPWTLTVHQDIAPPTINAQEEQQIIDQIQKSRIARVIFLTPTIWEKGAFPKSYDEKTGELDFEGVRVRLLTYAIGRPLLVGGWDIHKGRPKKRRPAVPAGSVYYVKVNPKQAEQLVQTIHSRNWSDFQAHEGYGFVVCGAYQDD